MPRAEVHQCECSHCQQDTPHPDQELHRQMNLLLSRLDEQQRRWYAAVESNRIGAGGDRLLAQITGLDEKTIQRGRQELEAGQLWKIEHGYIYIVELGKRLIRFKMLRYPNQRAVTRLIGIEALLNYLRQSEAELVI